MINREYGLAGRDVITTRRCKDCDHVPTSQIELCTVGRARLRIKGDNSKRDLPYRTLKGALTKKERHGLGRGATDVGQNMDRTRTTDIEHELGKSELCGKGTIQL